MLSCEIAYADAHDFDHIDDGATSSEVARSGDESGPAQAYPAPWFTGSLFSATAATLPQGHVLVEPYLYDVHSYGSFASNGSLNRWNNTSDGLRSLTLVLYGITNHFMVGYFPRFGWNSGLDGLRHSGLELGDSTGRIQYRLSKFDREKKTPMLSIAIDENIPTGQYDRLSPTQRGGLGSGAWTTTVSTFAEYSIWPISGHALRARLNLSYLLPSRAHLQDASVYGTPEDFRGYAHLGKAETVGLSLEYALTRNVALCSDFLFNHQAATTVGGNVGNAPYLDGSGPSKEVAVAPAVEYNWSSTFGTIIGVRFPIYGRNTSATIYPSIAFNKIF